MAPPTTKASSLLKRVLVVETDLNENRPSTKTEKKIDKFNFERIEIKEKIRQAKTHIQERQAIQRRDGNTMEVIRKGFIIENLIKELGLAYNSLSQAYDFNCKNKNQYNFDEDILEKQYIEVSNSKQQIDELTIQYKANQEILNFAYNCSEENEYSNWRAPTTEKVSTEDQEIIDQWKSKDEQLNVQIMGIGNKANEINKIAQAISDKTVKQTRKLEIIEQQVSKTDDNLSKVKMIIKDTMKKDSAPKFFVRFTLIFLAIILAFLIVSLSIQKFIL